MQNRNRARYGYGSPKPDDSIAVYSEDTFKYGGDPAMRRALFKEKDSPADLEQLKADVKCLLVSSPTLYTVTKLCNEYKKLIGRPMHYREFGFYSTIDLLRSFTDACEIDDSEGAKDPIIRPKGVDKLAHIQRLVSKNEKRVPRDDELPGPDLRDRVNKKAFIPYYMQDRIRYFLYKNKGLVSKEDFYKDVQKQFPLRELHLDIGVKGFVDALPQLLCIVDNKVKATVKIEKSEVLDDSVYPDNQWAAPRIRRSKLEVEMGRRVEKLAEKFPMGLGVYEFPHEYFKMYNSKFNITDFGFTLPQAFLVLLPGHYKIVGRGEEYVVVPGSFHDENEGQDFKGHQYLKLVGERGLNMLKLRIQNAAIFEIHNVESTHFLNWLMGIMHMKILFRHQNITPETFMKNLASENVITLARIGGKDVVMPNSGWKPKHLCPQPVATYSDNIVKPGESIPVMELPDAWIDNRRGCWAKIVHIINPSDFYIRVVGIYSFLDEDKEFKKWIKDMTSYYYKNYRKYEIPEGALKTGMICTCPIFGKYRRVKVLDSASQNERYVQDVDTGNVHRVATCHITFLDRKYMWDIRTYHCNLVNIEPYCFNWSLESHIEFESFVHRKNFFLHILYATQDLLHVDMTESTTRELSLTEFLTENNHAMKIANVQITKSLFASWEPIKDDSLDILKLRNNDNNDENRCADDVES